MSQRVMLQFSAGALFLLLPLFGDLAGGEISNDFHQCLQFFYRGIPPSGITGGQSQPICQRYENQYRFATLYNRHHLAPVYSAYILSTEAGSNVRNDWKYEPQLVSENANPEMADFPKTVDEDVKQSQAVPDDYSSSSPNPEYTKGHLAPASHQGPRQDREATYTLTNIVPQKESSNNGPWSTLESNVLTKSRQHCTGTMYVITGAIPYVRQQHLKDRVSIPEYMWSAYCCTSYTPNRRAPFNPTYAAVGRNDPNSGNDIVARGATSQGYDVREMTVQELESILRVRLNNTEIRLFHEQCRNSE